MKNNHRKFVLNIASGLFSQQLIKQYLIQHSRLFLTVNMFCRYDLESTDSGSFEEKSAEDGTLSATNSPTHNSSNPNRSYAARSVPAPSMCVLDFLDFSKTCHKLSAITSICLLAQGGGEKHTLPHLHLHMKCNMCIRIICIPALKVRDMCVTRLQMFVS